jgi:glycosyltransferase involved in cell wall biosynthesis
LRVAFCNTILTFDVAEALKSRGFSIISLVHEMPAVVGHFGENTLRRLAAASDAVVFGADLVRDKLEAACNFSHPRVSIVRTAVRETSPPSADDRLQYARRLRAEAGFPEGCIVVLGCGSIDHRKGVDLLIEIASCVRNEASIDIRFAWIGHEETDAYAMACASRVADLGLSDIFRFLPPRRGVDREIAGADMFALPSREDPFPLVNVSALALGTAVIAFAGSGGAPEVVAPDAGLVVPMADIAAFASAVLRLANSQEERTRMGEGGVSRYRRELTIESTVEKLFELVETLAISNDG